VTAQIASLGEALATGGGALIAAVVLGWQEYRRRHRRLGYQTRAEYGHPRVARWPAAYGDPTRALPGENRGANSPTPPPVK
jgi:hypothetical protein